MDLETMEQKLNMNKYSISPPDDGPLSARDGIKLFLEDAELIFVNAKSYNSPSSN